jgi:hypothetical protein
MTPFANAIVKELLLPEDRRTFEDRYGLMHKLSDAHTFEISQIAEVVDDLYRRMAWSVTKRDETLDLNSEVMQGSVLAFLPAPKTWIEWKEEWEGETLTTGVLIQSDTKELPADLQGGSHALCVLAMKSHRRAKSMGRLFLPLGREKLLTRWRKVKNENEALENVESQVAWILTIYASLAVINTPKIIGRIKHAPNPSLEKRLLNGRRSPGKFTLHPWTEIVLHVNKPAEIDDGEPHEAHLTGRRAFHFCRQHLRIMNGQLVLVRAHFRGDPAIGIKRSRYSVRQ